MLVPKQGANQGWYFHPKRSRHITDREVSQQWLEPQRLAGIPKESSCTVLAIASQRMPWENLHWVEFSTLARRGVHET